ncbi:MAG: VOC family protein [Burkholderiales bacterium]|nr:VOC family protein [Burkholderiales bacterium]
MPVLDSYIFFDGNCADAMRFYEKTLGGKLEALMTYEQSPDPAQCPPGSAGRVMHASLKLGDRVLMASDSPAGMHKPMGGFALSLAYDSVAEAQRIFDTLGAGGQVMMPMQKTFFAETFGMTTDRFGTPWMVGGGFQQMP